MAADFLTASADISFIWRDLFRGVGLGVGVSYLTRVLQLIRYGESNTMTNWQMQKKHVVVSFQVGTCYPR